MSDPSTIPIPGYELIELIGEGGMALIYKARQQSLNRVVAVKVLREELAHEATALAQFRLEANAVATLKHPNILMIHEAGQIGDRPFFVMEYVSAYSVYAWVTRKGRLSVNDALTVTEAVASALAYAWDKAGLIHGDLKPGNILVDEDGVVKVADFSGLSQSNLSQEAKLLSAYTIGTPNYMAPEQATGFFDLDFRSDIYSLGAVLYQLVTGVMPFEQDDDRTVMRQQIEGRLDDPVKLNPGLTQHVARLVEKMMVKDRDHRYASWSALIRDLQRVRAGKTPAPPLPYPGSSTVHRALGEVTLPARMKARSTPGVFKPYPVAAEMTLASTRPKPRTGRIAGLLAVAAGLLSFNLFLLWIYLNKPGWRPEPVPAPFLPLPPSSVSPAPQPTSPGPTAPRPRPEPAPGPDQPAGVVPDVPAHPEPAPTPQPGRRTLEGLRSYVGLVSEVNRLCRMLDFTAARRLLETWTAGPGGQGPWAAAARADLDRIALLDDVWTRMAQSGRLAAGRTLATVAAGTDELVMVQAGRAVITRRYGQGGTAQYELPLAQLGLDDLFAIMRKVDADRAPLHRAAWLFAVAGQAAGAQAELARMPAESADTAFLRAWLNDWSAAAANHRADRELDLLKQMVMESRFTESVSLGQRLRSVYAGTDIMAWARSTEMEELLRTAEEELEWSRSAGGNYERR
jgi:serine/threonine protein kinase